MLSYTARTLTGSPGQPFSERTGLCRLELNVIFVSQSCVTDSE